MAKEQRNAEAGEVVAFRGTKFVAVFDGHIHEKKSCSLCVFEKILKMGVNHPKMTDEEYMKALDGCNTLPMCVKNRVHWEVYKGG